MIGIRFSTRFFLCRPGPIRLPLRARREMGPIWLPLGPWGGDCSPLPSRSRSCSIHRRRRTALTLTPVIDRAEVKPPNKRRVDFVQPEF
jgi:hypothetical protein